MSLQSKRGLHAPPVSPAHEAYLRDHFVRAHPRAPGGSDPSTALVAAALTGEVPGNQEVEVDEDFLIGSAEALQWLMWAKTPEGMVEEETALFTLPTKARDFRDTLREAGHTGHTPAPRPIASKRVTLPHKVFLFAKREDLEGLAEKEALEHRVHYLQTPADKEPLPPGVTPISVTVGTPSETVEGFKEGLFQAFSEAKTGAVVLVPSRDGVSHAFPGVTGVEHREEVGHVLRETAESFGGVLTNPHRDLTTFLRETPRKEVEVPKESIEEWREEVAAPHRRVAGVMVQTLIADVMSAPVAARLNIMIDSRVMQVTPSFLYAMAQPWAFPGVSKCFLAKFCMAASTYLTLLTELASRSLRYHPVTQTVMIQGAPESSYLHVGWLIHPEGREGMGHPVSRWVLFHDLGSAPDPYLREIEESQWTFVSHGVTSARPQGPSVVFTPGKVAASVMARVLPHMEAEERGAHVCLDTVRQDPVWPHKDSCKDQAWFLGGGPSVIEPLGHRAWLTEMVQSCR